MIRSALIVLVATTLVPLRAVADPPTAYGPAVIDVTVASGDTLDSVLDRAGVPAGIRAEAARFVQPGSSAALTQEQAC